MTAKRIAAAKQTTRHGRRAKRTAVTHDYTSPTWGHAVNVIAVDGEHARVLGFGVGVVSGDFLLLPNGARSTRYRIETLERKRPADCWAASLKFMPRESGA